MSASTDYNYSDLLSLERARARRKGRLNFLGSKELVVDYQKIPESIKEECLEYLEDNLLTLTNPEINYKVHDGVWKCVDIAYNETNHSITQRFKIDSSLGSYPGAGDDSFLSVKETAERTYFWRVVDPESIELPSSTLAGTTYAKSSTENSDGTYDVTIIKTTAIETVIDSFLARKSPTHASTQITYNSSDASNIIIPSSVVGTIYDQSVSENQDGSYNITIRTTVASAITEEDNVTARSSGGYETTSFKWNASDIDDLAVSGSATAGTSEKKFVRQNEDGSYDLQLVKQIASSVEGTSIEATVFNTVTRTVTLNNTAQDYSTKLQAFLTAAGDDAFFVELSPDPGFDTSGAWTASGGTVSGSALSLGSSGYVATTAAVFEAEKFYRVKYVVTTADAGGKGISIGGDSSYGSNTPLPATVGTHIAIIFPTNLGSGLLNIVADAGLTNNIVLSSCSVSEWYGSVTGYEGTEPQILDEDSVPPGLVYSLENIPVENGLYRTVETTDVANFNIRNYTLIEPNSTGGNKYQLDIRNGTPAFIAYEVGRIRSTTATSSHVFSSRLTSSTLNRYGLFDVSISINPS